MVPRLEELGRSSMCREATSDMLEYVEAGEPPIAGGVKRISGVSSINESRVTGGGTR